jgi:hypothetical protein
MGYKFAFKTETDNGVVRTYFSEYAVEPAQRGGRDDPSWKAYPYLDGDILDENDNPVSSKEIKEAAEAAMDEDFRDRF